MRGTKGAGYGWLGDFAISFLVVALCRYQAAVSEPPAESRPKSRTPPGLRNPDAVAGMKENTALPACRDKGGGGTVAPGLLLRPLVSVDYI